MREEASDKRTIPVWTESISGNLFKQGSSENVSYQQSSPQLLGGCFISDQCARKNNLSVRSGAVQFCALYSLSCGLDPDFINCTHLLCQALLPPSITLNQLPSDCVALYISL